MKPALAAEGTIQSSGNCPQGLKPVFSVANMYGLKSLRENLHLSGLVPKGRLRVAQDAVLGRV